MAKKTEELLQQAVQIRDEQANKKNSALRVGTLFSDIIQELDETKNTSSSSLANINQILTNNSNKITELDNRLIKLAYVGTYNSAKTETSEIGDIFFNTNIRKLQKRLSLNNSAGDFDTEEVEIIKGSIYSYHNKLYVINEQGDLVSSTECIEALAIHNQNTVNNYSVDTTKIYKDNGAGKIQEVGLSGFYTCRIPIKKGNKFFLNSVGSGYDVFPYLISSEDLTIIQKPDNTAERYKGILEITQNNAAYLFVNCVNTYKDFAVRNYSDSTVLQQSESILIRRNWALENGLFDEEGNFEDNVLCKRVKLKLSTQDDELLFLKVGKGYTMIINDINPTTNQKENFEIYNHCSYTTQGREICVGFKKNDGTTFDDWDNAGFLAYSFFPKNIHENYDITIAASDSDPIYKNKADIVCDGDNDQFIIQCAMYNVMRDQKVLLYPGNFYLSEYRVIPSTKDDLGQTAFLTFQQPFDQFKRILHVDGYMRGIVQSETTGQTNIWIKKTVWDTIGETWQNPVVVIGGEKRNFFLHTLMQLSCLNFRGYDAKKSVCYIDGYWMANMMIDKCNCKSAEPTFGNFTYIPNRYNIGIRGLQGSPYGTNYIKDSLCWRCGTGYDIGGEHFIVENSAAAFCGLGFAFSDFNGHIKMEHNNMLIKCAISQCMKSIRFGRYGYDEDTDIDSLSEEEQAKINSYQVIEIYGLQYGESVFKTEGMQSLGYEDGMHYTEGPYEVFSGSWKGIITSQGKIAPSKGCKQFEIRNLNYNIRGDFDNSTERPNYYNPESNLFGLKFWDERTQKEYIVGQDGKWLDPARFAISAIKQIIFGDINLGEFEDGGFNGLGEDADTATDIRTRSFFCCGYFSVEFPSNLKVVINATQIRSSKTNIVAQPDTRYSNTDGYIRILCRYADGAPRDANLYDLAKLINIKYVTIS